MRNEFGEIEVVEKIHKTYNRSGSEKVERHQRVFASYEKFSLTEDRSKIVYKVLCLNNSLYDPLGGDSHRESTLDLKLKEVNRETFEYYLKYLRKNNAIYLTRASRSFINAQS